MNRIINNFGPCLIVVFIILSSCKLPTQKTYDETPTRGNIKIAVDESYQLLSEAELFTFQSIYRNAKINPVYLSEDSILQLFLQDSVRLMITSRKLTENEELYLKNILIIPRTTKIAYDALAFIINKKNPDSLIRYNTLKDIFTGKISKWKEINTKSKLDAIKVVFDKPGSNNVRMIMSKFNINGTLPNYCYSTQSNPDVITYVEGHPEALGIISVNWISDRDDSISHSFLKRVKVVAVTSEYYSEGDDFYTPHPAYIADKSYPFIRDVYAIKRETFTGLGSGFIQFVAGDQGQRIVLKAGMVPATMPVRLVQISKE